MSGAREMLGQLSLPAQQASSGRVGLAASETSPLPSAPPRIDTAAPRGAWLLWIWLLGPAGILVSAALLEVGSQRQVFVPGLAWPVPETCGLYVRFGVDCPGCGLTRGFIHLAEGQFSSAWHTNPASLPLFAFVALQIPLAILNLTGCRGGYTAAMTALNPAIMLGLLALIAAQWLCRLVL